ncbi:MAG: response regulator transcription factor [Lentisphaeria bacterium]|nr:response regulator transcription factor [Lentisphaeria bacterium]
MAQQILVVEDDKAIRGGIVDALDFSGYSVLETGNGTDAMEMALKFNYDLLLLDLNLPGIDGLQILKQLRTSRPTIPVIILTARGSENERIMGLKAGADDYMVKPFSVKELVARIEAVLRRTPERPTDLQTIKIPGGIADLEKNEIRFKNGVHSELSVRESELLRYLANSEGRVVTRDELLTHVWRVSAGVETRTVDMHIARLRDKLRDDPSRPDIIMTIRGKGYSFENKS